MLAYVSPAPAPDIVQPANLVALVATQYGLSVALGLLVGLVALLLVAWRS